MGDAYPITLTADDGVPYPGHTEYTEYSTLSALLLYENPA